MVFELLAKAINLAQWAETKMAKDRFPELIRRLCFATAVDPQKIEFAAVTLMEMVIPAVSSRVPHFAAIYAAFVVLRGANQ